MQRTLTSMRIAPLCIAALLIASSLFGQSMIVPEVTIDDRTATLQASLYPDYYRSHSARSDMRWVQANDSALTAFWDSTGVILLETMTSLSGIEWFEDNLTLYFVRYFPSFGSGDPLILPLGGIKRGPVTEAAPNANSMRFNLIYQLAHRNLAQTENANHPKYYTVGLHPLMRTSPYRRDNLAMLLTLVTAQKVLGLDSTYNAYNSAFWQNRFPGKHILQSELLGQWILSESRPLAQWVAEEPQSSQLVIMTRPPRQTTRTVPADRPRIEGLPLKGKLGFSVRYGEGNNLVVDEVDPYRLAHAAGLQEGDIIRSVNNARPRDHRDLIGKILAALQEGGATVNVVRDDNPTTVIIEPYALPSTDDDTEYWQYLRDSLENQTPADTGDDR